MAALVTTLSAVPTTSFRFRSIFNPNLTYPRRLITTTCKAKNTDKEEPAEGAAETFETLAIAGGLISNPVIGASLFKLKTTGCGLPPGPGGALGALEGVSYLVLAGIVGWSVYTKVKTGSGLPNGPFGLLGAVEGVSYLTVLAIVVIFGLQFIDMGYIPGPLPGEQCFG